jgi:putative ABC transport system permease protein
MNDLKFAFRQLLKQPGFTAVAVLTLALGIGANTAIFSFFNAIMLQALPYREAGRLVVVWAKPPSGGMNSVSAPNFLDWQKQSKAFSQLAAYHGEGFNLSGTEKAERIDGARVSASLFSVLGIEPTIGRSFRPDEDTPGSPPVALLSHRLWRQRFGGETNVVGESIQLNNRAHTVIGVMPPNFKFLSGQQIWTPLALDENSKNRDFHHLLVFGRLQPDVGLEHAQSEMAAIAARLAGDYPESNRGWSASVVPLRSFFVSPTDRLAGWVMLGIVVAVLLIACSNVANLFLARGSARQHELAIRSALGAGRWRIVRQLLCESFLLGLFGGAGGVLLAVWGVDVIKARLPTVALESIPNLAEVGIEGRVLLFTLFISLLTGVLFGLVPALQLSKPHLIESLKAGGRAMTSGLGRGRSRGLLVVTEFALATVLLTLAGLFMRCIWQWQTADLGYRTEHLLVVELLLSENQYRQRGAAESFFRQVGERVQNLPGVVSAGLTTGLPEGWNIGMPFDIERRPAGSPTERPVAGYRAVDPGYFRTMGIHLERGRAFTESDSANGHEVVIISQMMARRFWPNEDPIGQHILLEKMSPMDPKLGQPVAREIVGIARDLKYFTTDPSLSTEMYVPQSQNPVRWVALVVRTGLEPMSLAASVQKEIHAIDKEVPASNFQTMEQVIRNQAGGYRVFAELNSLFAGLALLLAAIGIYGVMAYSVAQRTAEIGIRMALGATTNAVLRQILRQGLILALTGVGIGLVGALAVARLVSGLMINLSPTDPITFVSVITALIGVALWACYLPARRATRIDPMIALRHE